MSEERKAIGEAPDKELGFLEHLEILRWHLIRSIAAVFILAIIAFFAKDFIFNKIIYAPIYPEFPTNAFLKKVAIYLDSPTLAINQSPIELISTQISGQFTMHLLVSMVLGIVFAFPYIFFEFWRFIAPALYENERRHAKGSIFYTSLLFFCGVAFGYYIIVPLSVHFLGSYSTGTMVENQIVINSYISTMTSIVLCGGVVFELPVIIYFLSKIGLVNASFLRTYRRHAIVLIIVLSAIITPPDVFSLVLVCLPLVLLYEVGILIASRIDKKREKEEAQTDSLVPQS